MNIIRLLLTFVFLSTCGALAAGRKTVTIVPINGKSVTLTINEKEREYYSLTRQTPIKFQIDGPGKLSLISRLILPKEDPNIEKYSLRIMEGKNTLKIQSTQTELSETRFPSSDRVLGKSRKLSIKISEGSFTYDLLLDDTQREAAVRLLFEPAKGAKKLAPIEPLSYDRIVTSMIKENLVAYYVASRERQVQLRVIGPTKVSVNARLNYDKEMKGKQKYSIVVTEGQTVVVQRALETTKSEGVTYLEWKNVNPGRPNSISFDVPKGEHTYQIALGEGTAKSVSMRFSIPQKDLTNEQ